MRPSALRVAAALAALGTVIAPTASADPAPADPAAPAPPGAAPPVDTGLVVSAPPSTMTSTDGVTLTLSASDEIQQPVAPLTTALSTREYDVGGVFRGSITGSAEPAKGILEVGYQIGCGIDMGTGPGVLIGANGGTNAALGIIDGAPLGLGGPGLIPNAGITGGGSVTVSLKPGVVNSVPVTRKQFKGESPRVSIRSFRIRIDGCVGESFIRSYAVLTRSTDERESSLAWYGESKKV